MRRGFTLMEIVLAAMLGGIVLLASLSLFYTMERADNAAAERFDRTSDLQRTRLVMARTFGRLLMSEEPPPARPRPGEENSSTSNPARNRSVRQRDPDAPLPPPRVMLMPRETGSQPSASLPSQVGVGPVQRLEVVVYDSPVPSSRVSGIDAWTRGGLGSIQRDRNSEKKILRQGKEEAEKAAEAPPPVVGEEGEEEEGEQPVRAFRGAFEFAPQPIDPKARELPTQQLYQLWWVPMISRRPVGLELDEARELVARAALDPPVLLCSNIVDARWRMYDDRVKKDELVATWDTQLPAYVEFEIRLSSGANANWMFEVGNAAGPEVRIKPEERSALEGKNAEAKNERIKGLSKDQPQPAGEGEADK